VGGARLDVKDTASTTKAPAAASGAIVVLLTLAAGQFLMTLDTSVKPLARRPLGFFRVSAA
jgi:hypothetical protein